MLRPLRDRVVVKPHVRALSDIIAINNREPFNEGVILSVGPDVYEAKPGDFIKYGNGDYLKWPTQEIDGETVQVIQEADIACIVEE